MYPNCGALVTFEGHVRNHHGGRSVQKLIYQAYESMAESEIAKLIHEIRSEWPMCQIQVRHRLGELFVGDIAVAIAVWSPHRREAFAACEAAINRLKKRVPIWKKEFYADGTAEWVMCHHGEVAA
jgi:molybdopterin synthase catalytic subunit